MAKKNVYQCTNCGFEQGAWAGKCPSCMEWSSMVEVASVERGKQSSNFHPETLIPLSEVNTDHQTRLSTGFTEIDELLGGGFVAGSVVLLGGEPGIGKSTLALQLAAIGKSTLYVSGEESSLQVKTRADRLAIKQEHITLLEDTDVMHISLALESKKFSLVIVDSMQTLYHPDFPNTPGSQVQVRESALTLVKLARRHQVPILLIGHVTKEGSVAGPRMLEHLVDVLLYLEGERTFGVRMLRTVKNRFGATSSEIVKMTETGFIPERQNAWLVEADIAVPGSAVTVAFIGKRPLVIEIQALVEPMNANFPRRNSPNFAVPRLDQIIAIINAHTKTKLYNHDVFINIVGGITISDPGIDAAIAGALLSAKTDRAIARDYALVGELSLSGQVREPTLLKDRLKEAKKVGFSKYPNCQYVSQLLERILA